MAIIQRPAKQGGSTTYQGKVALGYTKILASEADADHDTIYAAWNGGVDTVNIHDGAVTSAKLAAGAVGTRELAEGGVATADLADGAVGTQKLADAAVTGLKIAPRTIMAGHIGQGQVGSYEIAEGTIITADLADGAVATGKLADAAVTGAKIAPRTIVAGHIGEGQVGSFEIAEGSIITADLADGAVTSPKIAPNSATTGGNQASNATDASIVATVPFLTLSLTNYRGGHIIIGFSMVGWVYGGAATTPGRMDVSIRVNSGLVYLVPINLPAILAGAHFPWTAAGTLIHVAAAGTQTVELLAGRFAGSHDWRHIYSNLSILGLS